MRLTLHWRGKPLFAVDLAAHSPDDDVPDDDGPTLQATSGGDFERAEPMEALDTTVRIGPRKATR